MGELYDDPDFLAGYRTLPRSVDGLDGAPEWPALRAMLPPLEGRRVVDLGCGFGWFCDWAMAEGAARVVGIDVAAAMLQQARSTTDDGIEYRQADLTTVATEPGAFDVVYSSLALHYSAELSPVMDAVRRSLAPGGCFVFSVEHPLFTAPTQPDWIDIGDRTVWPLDGYLDEGPRTTTWFVDDVVKHHRTIATHVQAAIAAGFVVDHLEEWGPSPVQVVATPEWARELDRPPFLLMRCSVPTDTRSVT